MSRDQHVRSQAFEWLAEQERVHGDVLEWKLLARGFQHEGMRVPLLSQQGIFKPAVCDLPLSIRTSLGSPYHDRVIEDQIAYSYRGKDPQHVENRGLRRCMQDRIPLVYFHAVVEGRYLATWPVLIVADEVENLRFWVQAEAGLSFSGVQLSGPLGGASITDPKARRQYATRLVQTRLHQRGFRERVLRAYMEQCAMCRLRERDLLDAAHIKPDSAGGAPEVFNGISLCKIHHAAFDVGVLGIHPTELRIRVRRDVLEQVDGPMLRHGIQGLNGEKIRKPRAVAHQPDPELLRWKWERFGDAG